MSTQSATPTVDNVTQLQSDLIAVPESEGPTQPRYHETYGNPATFTRMTAGLKMSPRPQLMPYYLGPRLQQVQEPPTLTFDMRAMGDWDIFFRPKHRQNRGIRHQTSAELPPVIHSRHSSGSSTETLVDLPPHDLALALPDQGSIHGLADELGLHLNNSLLLSQDASTVKENYATQFDCVKYVDTLEAFHDAEVKQLRSQVFAAETTIKARDVEIANDQDDYEADISALKEELDAAKKKSEACNQELECAANKVRNAVLSAKAAKDGKRRVENKLRVSRQQTREAMQIAEGLRSELDRVKEERDRLAEGSSIRVYWDQKTQIQLLQQNLETCQNEKNELRGAFEFQMTMFSEEKGKKSGATI